MFQNEDKRYLMERLHIGSGIATFVVILYGLYGFISTDGGWLYDTVWVASIMVFSCLFIGTEDYDDFDLEELKDLGE